MAWEDEFNKKRFHDIIFHTGTMAGFFKTGPVTQPSTGAQAATTAATSSSPWGFSSSTLANQFISVVVAMQAALKALGLSS